MEHKIMFEKRTLIGIIFKNGIKKTFEVIDFEEAKTRLGHKLILNLKSKDLVFDINEIEKWGMLK